jgi:SHAQKYF class myb-like DNA-binding protein
MSTEPIKPDNVASDQAPTIPEVSAVTDRSMPPFPVPVMTEPNKADALAPKPSLPTGVATRPASIKQPAATHPPSAPVVPNLVPSSVLANNKSKSKKKKHTQPAITMATATAATSGAPGALGENTGRWTAEEHRLFLQGLDQHGKGWKKIASLIKSRTVVQIRTHAQKYFQKLAKARQNGEEGDVAMEGRGGVTSIPMSPSLQSTKRRRQTGTKRKAISSVVASSQRQGKRMAAAQAAGVPSSSPPLPAVAPALAPFVPPTTIPSITTANGTISLPALEDSLYVTAFATVLYFSFLCLSLTLVAFLFFL